MIKTISVRNYKSFKNATISFAPVTILLGANSSGKSSIINFFKLLQQTGKIARTFERSAINFNDNLINSGKPINLINRKDPENTIELELEFESEELLELLNFSLIEGLKSRLFHAIRSSLYYNAKLTPANINLLIEKLNLNDRKLAEKVKELAYRPMIRTYQEVLESREDSLEILARFNSAINDSQSNQRIAEDLDTLPGLPSEFISGSDLLIAISTLQEIKSFEFKRNFKLFADFRLSRDQQRLNCVRIGIGSEQIPKIVELSGNFNEGDIDTIQLTFDSSLKSFKANSYLDDLAKGVEFGNTFLNLFTKPNEVEYETSRIIFRIFETASNSIIYLLSDNSIDHIGPLRAHPKRYYLRDTVAYISKEELSTINLLKTNIKVREKINLWLGQFHFGVSSNKIDELIDRISVNLPYNNEYENNENDSSGFDITDVGFGLSQVLPILTTLVAKENPVIVFIEQPEVHLHPRMQSRLADMFSDITRESSEKTKKCMIIETHSEYLVTRLRALVASGKLREQDIRVFFFEPEVPGLENRIREEVITHDGGFSWPDWFFTEENEDKEIIINARLDSLKRK